MNNSSAAVIRRSETPRSPCVALEAALSRAVQIAPDVAELEAESRARGRVELGIGEEQALNRAAKIAAQAESLARLAAAQSADLEALAALRATVVYAAFSLERRNPAGAAVAGIDAIALANQLLAAGSAEELCRRWEQTARELRRVREGR